MFAAEPVCVDEYGLQVACGSEGASWLGDGVQTILQLAALAIALAIIAVVWLLLVEKLRMNAPTARRHRREFVDTTGEVARLRSEIAELQLEQAALKAKGPPPVGQGSTAKNQENFDLLRRYNARSKHLEERASKLQSGLKVDAYLRPRSAPPWRRHGACRWTSSRRRTGVVSRKGVYRCGSL